MRDNKRSINDIESDVSGPSGIEYATAATCAAMMFVLAAPVLGIRTFGGVLVAGLSVTLAVIFSRNDLHQVLAESVAPAPKLESKEVE